MAKTKLSKFEESEDDATQYEEGSVSVPFKGTEDAKLLEKLKDYSYQYGPTQQETMREALRKFLADKDIKPRPEAVKNRTKVGRKRKKFL
jgi:hypothetical protein